MRVYGIKVNNDMLKFKLSVHFPIFFVGDSLQCSLEVRGAWHFALLQRHAIINSSSPVRVDSGIYVSGNGVFLGGLQ